LEKIPKQFFTAEFTEEAVRLVVDGGLTLAEAGRLLSVNPQTLKNWVNRYKQGNLTGPGTRSVSEFEAEVSRLRKGLAEARLEKEILKNRPGTKFSPVREKLCTGL
jgi:transposase